MVNNRKERLSHMISLGAQLSFDIHYVMFQNARFGVIGGQ